jgi:hypothetical protein
MLTNFNGISTVILGLNEIGGNTEINFGDKTLAILNGITS